MSERERSTKTMSVREAIARTGFEALARADFGSSAAYYVARRAGGGDGEEVLVRLIVGGGEREVRAACVLSHPGALHLIGVEHAPGYRLLVFEAFRGRSLAREIDRLGRIDARRALRIGAGAARVLAHAHGLEIAHGEVSAANIVLGLKGEVKLAGFGAAWASGGADASPDDDLIRLGAALWRAVTGGRPPGAREVVDSPHDIAAPDPTAYAAGARRLTRLRRVPASPQLGKVGGEEFAAVARLLERAMRLRPEIGFYPDATALATALESAVRRLGEAQADMTGRFAENELAELLQMLEIHRKSGRLELSPGGGGEAGAIAFRDGRIVAARAGREQGRAALLRLLAARGGRFRMWFGPVAGSDGGVPISAALLEALRLRDEESRTPC